MSRSISIKLTGFCQFIYVNSRDNLKNYSFDDTGYLHLPLQQQIEQLQCMAKMAQIGIDNWL